MKSIISLIVFLIVCVIINSPITAQESGYEISVRIEQYDGDTAFLAYRRADKVYSRDTTALENGQFVFKGDEVLPTGVYLVLMPPDNKFFEFIVTPDEQHFSVETKAPDFFDHLTFKNAPDNDLLNEYQNYMNEKIAQANAIQEQIGNAQDESLKAKFQVQQERLMASVRDHQNEIRTKKPNSFTSKLIGAFQEPEVPEPPLLEDGTPDSRFQFQYYKSHFFDSFDFSEPGFVNTPYLKQKIDQYLDKLNAQRPDSLKVAVDYILQKAQMNEQVFRFTLPHILNKYYRPNIVGLDEVYVHVANKYYKTGRADWVSEDNLKKILDDAYMINNVLIGNPAPQVSCQLYDYDTESWTENLISLYDIQSKYTVVFLWKPGCPACKKMTEELKAFYEEWKEKGVEVYAISSAAMKDLEKAKNDIIEKDVSWITVADPKLKARALVKFYGTSLPKLYLLDKDKKILASRVGASQLEEIISKNEEEQDMNGSK